MAERRLSIRRRSSPTSSRSSARRGSGRYRTRERSPARSRSAAPSTPSTPTAFRHGIRAVEDPALLEELAERRIVLDVTPLSNLRTGVVASLEDHPLPELVAAGIPCTVSTDDPEMFDTDLTREYEAALSIGIDPKALYEAGVEGALCSDETRARLRQIGEDYDWSAVGAEATA